MTQKIYRVIQWATGNATPRIYSPTPADPPTRRISSRSPMGNDDFTPKWDYEGSGYRVVFEGDPPLEVTLSGGKGADGRPRYPGMTLTTMVGVNAIPAVCNADPGVVTHLDLGIVQPHGLVRS